MRAALRPSLLLAALLLGPAFLAPFASSRAQQSREPVRPGSGSRTFEEEVEVSWVLVPVVVRSRGGYVEELAREDFRVFVDGRRVAIESFDSSRDAATSLVWLQDLSGSMANGDKLEASRQAFRFFLDRARPADEFAIATFAGGLLEVEVPFTSNAAALTEAAQRWRGYGTTTLHDAVAFLPEITDEGRHRKRAVVLVTDGVDNASVLAPAEARLIVRQARLPVYVLGFTTADPRELRRRVHQLEDEEQEESQRFARLLNRLARATGGRFVWVTEPAQIELFTARVVDELRHQYVLGFPARAEPHRYREIRVEVEGRRKADILHRRGYSGGPPAPSP